jgi:hypothetical protein
MTEHQIQSLLFKWFKLQHPKLLMFAIPNAAKRSYAQASYMKSEGLVAGIADIFLMCPTSCYHGMFIELKSAKGKVSSSQKEFMAAASSMNYLAVVCFGFDEAKEAITKYLQDIKK